MKHRKIFILTTGLALTLLIAISSISGIANARSFQNGKYIVTGKGEVFATPDAANITISIQTEEKTLAEAENKNTQTVKEVTSALIEMGIAETNITTQSFYADKKYSYENNAQTHIGYYANNTLIINLTDLNLLNQVIQKASSLGATSFNGIDFYLTNNQELYNQALSKALEDARQKARTLSGKENLVLVQIVEENISQFHGRKAIAYNETSKAIFSGEVSIKASIKAVFNTEENETSQVQQTNLPKEARQTKTKATRQIVENLPKQKPTETANESSPIFSNETNQPQKQATDQAINQTENQTEHQTENRQPIRTIEPTRPNRTPRPTPRTRHTVPKTV